MKYPVVATLTGQGLSVTRVCKLLGLSRSGFYAWVNRLINPSDQQLRRDELTVVIKGIHAQSRNTYGSRRVHAELTMDLGISVSKPTTEKIMRSNGIYGLPTKRKYRKRQTLLPLAILSIATLVELALTNSGLPISPSTPLVRASSTAPHLCLNTYTKWSKHQSHTGFTGTQGDFRNARHVCTPISRGFIQPCIDFIFPLS